MKPYKLLFKELERDKYVVKSVYEYFIEGKSASDKVNAILRIDVDSGLHLSLWLAYVLHYYGFNGSFYFLTFPERYYNIWKSDVPKVVSDLGFEVGLHTDHYYQQLIFGDDALEGIRRDIKRLSKLISKPIYGMVYHGHKSIDELRTTNWEVYKYVSPEELGLKYHDGVYSPYTKPNSHDFWQPNTDHFLSDFLGVPGGWYYCAAYPIKVLRKAKPGESVHIVIHPLNVFSKWWIDWPDKYDEKMPESPTLSKHLYNFFKVRYALGVKCLAKYPRIYHKLRRLKEWVKM